MHSGTTTKAAGGQYPVNMIEVAVKAGLSMIYRYDRTMICLMLVGLAGLLVQAGTSLGFHPVLAGAFACGLGGIVTLVCISVVWGRWQFMKPLGWFGVALGLHGIVVAALAVLPVWGVWQMLQTTGVNVGDSAIGGDWLVWKALGFGAVLTLCMAESTMLAWPMRSTSELGYLQSNIEMLGWPVEDKLYNRYAQMPLGAGLLLVVFWVPGVALLVPVYVAMFSGTLFYAVWEVHKKMP